MQYERCDLDFPSSPEVENPPASAGDMGSIPGLGRSHMPSGPHATTAAEATNATRAEPPRAATGESPHTATKTQWAAKDR